MPRIPEYTAPIPRIRPSDFGYRAFITAGRRLGGQYSQAAQRTAATAQVKAQILADQAQWPFTLLELQQKFAEGAGGGGGFRVTGFKSDPFGQFAPRVARPFPPEEPQPSGTSPSRGGELVTPGEEGGGVTVLRGGQNALAAQAADLTSQLGQLIGSTDTTGGTQFVPVGPVATIPGDDFIDTGAAAQGPTQAAQVPIEGTQGGQLLPSGGGEAAPSGGGSEEVISSPPIAGGAPESM